MARFMGVVKGSGNEVSRLGTPRSGLIVNANGWEFGVDVRLYVNEDGEDAARVTLTKGSSQSSEYKVLGTYTKEDLA